MTTIPLNNEPGDPDADIASHDTYLSGFPHAAFERLRGEAPAVWIEEEDGSGFWAVTRHADVVEVSRDFGHFSAARGIRIEDMAEDELEARRTMMEFDPPEHTRLRRLVQSGFSPKVVATYEEAFRRLTNHVLDNVLDEGEFDVVTEIARELPIRMLCRLLGVPESDAGRLVAWGDQMISNADPEYTPVIIDKVDTEEYRLLPFRSPAALEVFLYAEEMALERRANPQDDIVTTLLTAEPDGEPEHERRQVGEPELLGVLPGQTEGRREPADAERAADDGELAPQRTAGQLDLLGIQGWRCVTHGAPPACLLSAAGGVAAPPARASGGTSAAEAIWLACSVRTQAGSLKRSRLPWRERPTGLPHSGQRPAAGRPRRL